MPELPEVQTTVDGLQKYVVGFSISSVWTDLAILHPIKQFESTLKSTKFLSYFIKNVTSQKIIQVERRAKNILIHLENNMTILVHMKMTGHMMIGNYVYNKKLNTWNVHPEEQNTALFDPYNRFVHVVFTIQKGNKLTQLVLCDARKFAKVTLFDESHLAIHLHDFGPEPLSKEFTVSLLKKCVSTKMNGKIKQVLLDQSIISGIGNIYSDEALWLSNIHPERIVQTLTQKEYKLLHKNIQRVLSKGIDFGGDSTSDYRNVHGEKGKFHGTHNVYRETNKPCKKKRCSGIIKRIIVGTRSTHFCPVHQK